VRVLEDYLNGRTGEDCGDVEKQILEFLGEPSPAKIYLVDVLIKTLILLTYPGLARKNRFAVRASYMRATGKKSGGDMSTSAGGHIL